MSFCGSNVLVYENVTVCKNKDNPVIARDLLLHPVRLRIVQALAGRAATPLELKNRLGDVAQASLYRHLAQLHDGGMIEIVSERQVRGSVERTYGLIETATSLDADDVADATPEDHLRYFATFLGSVLSDFARYIRDDSADIGADGVGYRQVSLWLSDNELDELVTALRNVIEPLAANEASPERRQRRLSTILMPDEFG